MGQHGVSQNAVVHVNLVCYKYKYLSDILFHVLNFITQYMCWYFLRNMNLWIIVNISQMEYLILFIKVFVKDCP